MNRIYTAHEFGNAYTVGYVAGFRTLRNTVPTILSRPPCPTDVGDQKHYFYELGLEEGVEHAASLIAGPRSR